MNSRYVVYFNLAFSIRYKMMKGEKNVTMKKKLLSLLMALAVVFSIVVVPGFKSEAAAYPTITARKAQYSGEVGVKTTACEYDVKHVGKYNKVVINVYYGETMTKVPGLGVSKTYTNCDGYTNTITYTIRAGSADAGALYRIEAKMQYSSNGVTWYDAPNPQITTFIVGAKSGEHRNEYYKGYWYDANGKQSGTGVLNWHGSGSSWWVQDTNGWYPKSQWLKIDGAWYYFTAAGYMDYGEYRDGYWLNYDGTCSNYPVAHWYSGAGGWYYMDASGWYPTNQYLWIDGVCYWFDGAGYTH